MSLMMSGNDKAFCKLPMEMSSTTVTLKNSSSVLENDSILERLPLTAGEPSRWYKTSKAWALLLFLSARDLRIVRTDPAGNIKADKEKSTEKIDGAVATIMGLDRAIRCGNNTGASVYDDRGILSI